MRILSSTSFAGFITFSSILCLDFTCAMVSSDSIAEFTRIHSDFKRLAVSQPNYKHDAFSEGRISPEADSDSSPESSSVSPAPSSLSNSSSDSDKTVRTLRFFLNFSRLSPLPFIIFFNLITSQ